MRAIDTRLEENAKAPVLPFDLAAWQQASDAWQKKHAKEAESTKAHRVAMRKAAQTPEAAAADLARIAERDGLRDMGPLPDEALRVDEWAAGVDQPRGEVVMRLGVSWISDKGTTETRTIGFRLDPHHAKSLSDLLHNASARAQLARQALQVKPGPLSDSRTQDDADHDPADEYLRITP